MRVNYQKVQSKIKPLSKKGLRDFIYRKSNTQLVFSELKALNKENLIEHAKTLEFTA